MNIKQTMRNLMLGGLLLIPIAIVAQPATTYAAKCGNVETSIISCEQNEEKPSTVQGTGLWGILILTINILIAGVGILAIAGFMYGGYLYITSAGSPDQVKKARTVFTNVVIGVIAFGAMYAVLNFIIPGGVFN